MKNKYFFRLDQNAPFMLVVHFLHSKGRCWSRIDFSHRRVAQWILIQTDDTVNRADCFSPSVCHAARKKLTVGPFLYTHLFSLDLNRTFFLSWILPVSALTCGQKDGGCCMDFDGKWECLCCCFWGLTWYVVRFAILFRRR